jgi:hypothetical protein
VPNDAVQSPIMQKTVRLRERRPRVKRIGYLKDHGWRAQPVLIDKGTKPMLQFDKP